MKCWMQGTEKIAGIEIFELYEIRGLHHTPNIYLVHCTMMMEIFPTHLTHFINRGRICLDFNL